MRYYERNSGNGHLGNLSKREECVSLPAPAGPPIRFPERALEAANDVRRRWPKRPRVGLILGTGLGGLAEAIDAEAQIPYDVIAGFPRSTALSHRGQLVCGDLAGVPVVAMEGRCHLYEGYSLDDLTLPVHTLQALGIQLLVLSNASGGLNPRFCSGDVVIIEDHIDLMFRVGADRAPADFATFSFTATEPTGTTGRTARPRMYCPELIDAALRVARRENFAAHRGVYVAMTGPNYETRAEYRFLRRIGGDVVGMSTVPEAAAAAACGLRTLALSIVTNVARPDIPTQTNAADVVRAAESAERHARRIVMDIVGDL